jgi:hypothetical protein
MMRRLLQVSGWQHSSASQCYCYAGDNRLHIWLAADDAAAAAGKRVAACCCCAQHHLVTSHCYCCDGYSRLHTSLAAVAYAFHPLLLLHAGNICFCQVVGLLSSQQA